MAWSYRQDEADAGASAPTYLTGRRSEVHIAVRNDGLGFLTDPTAGTLDNPYDGSTRAKFDAVMTFLQSFTNLKINLGLGTFQTSNAFSLGWYVKSGWSIKGQGMYLTTIKEVAGVAMAYNCHVLESPYNASTDNVTISDLTLDANGSAFGTTYSIDGTRIYGSHNLIERVRVTNTYGSVANSNEAFGICLSAYNGADCSDCHIRFCVADGPLGNYSNAFSLTGWEDGTERFLTDSSIVGCQAFGINNGLVTLGFTVGGINGSGLKRCSIERNTFIDCAGIFYCDTGGLNEISIVGNKLTRGWNGVMIIQSTAAVNSNINILNNDFLIQDRTTENIAVKIASLATTTKVVIQRNRIAFAQDGSGTAGANWIAQLSNDQITFSDNVIDLASNGAEIVNATALATNTIVANNLTPAGVGLSGLGGGGTSVLYEVDRRPQISRVTTQFDKVNNTLANVTELTASVLAGKTYLIEANLFVSLHATGLGKFALGGTATATTLKAHILGLDDADIAASLIGAVTALGASVAGGATTVTIVKITGIIVVNAAGTLTVQFAQSVTNASASSVLIGSTFSVTQIA